LSHRFSRGAAAKAIAVSLAIIFLSGCAVVETKPFSGGPQPHADATVAAEYSSLYEQKVNWKKCGSEKSYCASIQVPINWNNPEGGRLKIALAYRQADNAKALGSVIFNPGGPGVAGASWIRDSADSIGTAELRKNFNLVGFDPRGVGESEPKVKCFDAKDTDELLYGTSGEEIASAADVAYTKAKMKKFAEACAANTGPNLAFVDTISVAKDLDLIRAVFGTSKINYLGFSYGTYIGAVYASLFPKRVGHMVLDGAIDPTRSPEQENLSQLKGFDQALRNFLADCVQSKDCPFSGDVASAQNRIIKLLASIEKNPLKSDSGREVTISAALTGIIMPLYGKDWWPTLSQAFADALHGDGTTLLELADNYNERNQDGSYASNALEANIAISCLDGRAPSDDKSRAKSNKEILAASAIFGKYWQDSALSCAAWPYPVTKPLKSFRASGSETILVVGTTGDPATPYAEAVSLANDVLENAQLITFNGEGHTAYGLSSSCVNNAVDNYFIKHVVPATDPECG
jgi:pimeloyl-ACP methyl ester carboxylesterase